jgi:hypothetical protein
MRDGLALVEHAIECLPAGQRAGTTARREQVGEMGERALDRLA